MEQLVPSRQSLSAPRDVRGTSARPVHGSGHEVSASRVSATAAECLSASARIAAPDSRRPRCTFYPFVFPLCIALMLVAGSAWAGSPRTSRVKDKPIADISVPDTDIEAPETEPPTKARKASAAKTDSQQARADADLDGPLFAPPDRAPASARRTSQPSPSPASIPATDARSSDRATVGAGSPTGPERVSVLDIIGKLCAMLLCMFGLFTGVKMFKGRGVNWLRLPRTEPSSSHLQVIESLPLGGSRCLYLVQAGEKTVLVGADGTGLAALGEIAPAGQARGAGIGTPLLETSPAPRPPSPSLHDTGELGAPLSGVPRELIAATRELRTEPPSAALGRAKAQESRDEDSWARKRDLLIRALKEKAAN